MQIKQLGDEFASGASVLGRTAAVLAHGEGLTAHARSAEARIRKDD